MTQTHLRHAGAVLALLSFAQLIIALDYNIVFVALPAVSESLPFSDSGLQWVVSAYAVVFGGFLMLGGRLSDLFGRRRMFVTGLVLYGVASLVGGFATEPWMLIVARAGQGIGGAVLSPSTLSLVTTLFSGASRNKALGVWAAAGSTGMIIGSLLGGVLTSAFGWEAVFFVNVPLAAIGLVGAYVLLPADGVRQRGTRLDIPGAVTSTLGILSIVYGMVQAPEVGWGSTGTVLWLALGVALIVVFVAIERKVAVPLVPMSLFRNTELRLGTATTFLFMASFGAVPYFVTIYLQQIMGLSPFVTGIVFMMPSACVLIGTMIGGRLSNIWSSRRILVTAWTVGAASTTVVAFVMVVQGPLLVGAIPFAILSLSQGVVFTVMFAVSTSTIPMEDQGIGSGIATSGQQIGGAVGLAVLVAGASAFGGMQLGGATVDFTSSGMVGIVVLMIVGLIVPMAIRSRHTRVSGAKVEDLDPLEL